MTCGQAMATDHQKWMEHGSGAKPIFPRRDLGSPHPSPGTHAVQLALLPQVEGISQLLEGVLQVDSDEGSQDRLWRGGHGVTLCVVLSVCHISQQMLSQPTSTVETMKITKIVFAA